MATLAAFGILTGVGSFILTATMAIQAQSKGINADLFSVRENMDKATGSLNEAKQLMVANISFLSRKVYDQSSVQSQTLDGELSNLKKQLRAYNPNFFNSGRLKALADSVEQNKSACDDFRQLVLQQSLVARERAHSTEIKAKEISQQQELINDIQVLYLDAIAHLQNIVRDTKAGTEFDLPAGLDAEKLFQAREDAKSWMD